jgi:uncharacterized LabA/DUF88 family protein
MIREMGEHRRRLFKAIYIDGSFLFHSSKSVDIRINYKRLIQLLLNTGDFLVSANYYTALPNEYDMEEKHKTFLKILKKDVRLRIKSVPLLKTPNDAVSPGYRYSKGEDILLAAEMVRDAALDRFDTAVLLTGDADFIPAVNMVQDMGKPVVVASFHSSLSHTLELEASDILYLDEHLDKIRL